LSEQVAGGGGLSLVSRTVGGVRHDSVVALHSVDIAIQTVCVVKSDIRLGLVEALVIVEQLVKVGAQVVELGVVDVLLEQVVPDVVEVGLGVVLFGKEDDRVPIHVLLPGQVVVEIGEYELVLVGLLFVQFVQITFEG